MKVVVEAFKLAKAGNAPEEYEDDFCPREAVDTDVHSFRIAVSDGATETSFSGLWAKILVDAFADGRLRADLLSDELMPLQQQWRQEVERKPLPWYAEEKVKSGAFATLIGFEIAQNKEDGAVWSAIAVGDSCIMQIRDNQLIQSFPLEHAEEFDNSPFLISSTQSNNGKLAGAIRRTRSPWTPGDVFYLMTDALACYFLRLWDTPDKRDDLLSHFNNLDGAAFEKLVNYERQDISAGLPSLRNDDVTFVRCRMGGD